MLISFLNILFVSLGIAEEDLVHGILGFHVKKDPRVNAGRYADLAMIFVASDHMFYALNIHLCYLHYRID